MRRFEGKVVLVTGAASGIGRATVERLASEGAKLFCADVQAEALQAAAKRAVELGAEADARVCDVSSEDDVVATVAACVARFGRLDSLCHVAGILRFAHTHEMSFAREISDRVCFLEAGRILEEGPPAQVFSAPANGRTAQFLQRVIDSGRM